MTWLTSQAPRLIQYLFLILVFFTPLIFFPKTYELFEWNKMFFVYLITLLITSLWALRMVGEKKWRWTPTPLDLPLALFFLANLLATVFSIDIHTSIFGYYSRLNGGLLSTISYLLLYYAFMANFPKDKVRTLLSVLVAGGVVVSLWAIPEHFGIDPSCKILVDSWKADCWVQDVQARVFATLGQPNWLAAYLGMLLPISLGFVLLEKKLIWKIGYLVATAAMLAALIFTYSRGGMLGLVAGLGLFVTLLFIGKKSLSVPKLGVNWRYLAAFLAVVVAYSLIFGTAFNKPVSTYFKSQTPVAAPAETEAPKPATGTQLEGGGTESGVIRFIVWQGALDIWRHYPLLGSGVETFAYAYYQYRPVAHNHTTEWDFLYNKAHNEYLNYLATTGSFGFLSYLLIIFTFTGFMIWKLWSNGVPNRPLALGLMAGYTAYLVQNFFSFSVVIIALFFFLFPAIAFKVTALEERTYQPVWSRLGRLKNYLFSFLPRLALRQKLRFAYQPEVLFGVTLLITALLVYGLGRAYAADINFSKGFNSEGEGSWQTSKYFLEQAVIQNPLEPFYRAELGFVNAVLAGQTIEQEALGIYLEDAQKWARSSVEQSPKNLSYWRTLLRVYLELMDITDAYNEPALQAAQRSSELAPTEPKVQYNLGVVYTRLGRLEEAARVFKKVTDLKPDYREAWLSLARTYDAAGKRDNAIETYRRMRTLFPQETEAKIKLKEWTGQED